MPVISDAIEQLKRDKPLVDVYRHKLSGKPLTGSLINHNNLFMFMALVEEDGVLSGFGAVRFPDVTSMRWDTNRLHSLGRLIQRDRVRATIPEVNLITWRALIETLFQSFGHVSLIMESREQTVVHTGVLVDIDDRAVAMHEFGGSDTLDTPSVVLMYDHLTAVRAGSKNERDLAFLYSGH